MQKNVASQKIALFAFDTTSGAAKTGDSANITPYVSKDYGTVTVLGTTTATEMDATNAKGWYSFVLTQGETNGDSLLFTAKSTTANISIVGRLVFADPPNFSLLSIDGSGRADVIKIAGTTQTAGDVYARIGAPAGASIAADVAAVKVDIAAVKVQTDKLAFTVTNQVDANVLDWKSATAPAMTGDAFARLGAPAGASVSADVAAVKVDTAAVKVQTDKLAFTVTNQVDANVLDWKSATAPAMTGDAFARLGAPAGASVSADVAAVKVDTAAVPTANANADALLDRADAIETGVTPRKALRLDLAVLGAKLSGAGSGTEVFRNAVADSKNRVTATVDTSGNRTAITYDLT